MGATQLLPDTACLRDNVTLFQQAGKEDNFFGLLLFRGGDRILAIPRCVKDFTTPWQEFNLLLWKNQERKTIEWSSLEGKTVSKSFGYHGIFEGIIDDVDEETRLFFITYEDDDWESIPFEDIHHYLTH